MEDSHSSLETNNPPQSPFFVLKSLVIWECNLGNEFSQKSIAKMIISSIFLCFHNAYSMKHFKSLCIVWWKCFISTCQTGFFAFGQNAFFKITLMNCPVKYCNNLSKAKVIIYVMKVKNWLTTHLPLTVYLVFKCPLQHLDKRGTGGALPNFED